MEMLRSLDLCLIISNEITSAKKLRCALRTFHQNRIQIDSVAGTAAGASASVERNFRMLIS